MITAAVDQVQVVDWIYPSSPVRSDTACNAKPQCSKGCVEWVPGRMISGIPSCVHCTHSEQVHRVPNPTKKKATKRS